MSASSKQARVTVADVARCLGLSSATVSFVLNGKAEEHRICPATVERVQSQADKMGYRPNPIARQLAGMRSNAVGVLISTAAAADPRFLQQMEVQAASRDLRFIVGHAVGTKEHVKRYLDDFRARGVDGIISIFHCHPDYPDTVLPELARFKNVVYFERPDGSESMASPPCFVQPDYYEVGRTAVQHLIDRGRRRIGMAMSDLVFPYARARHQAYEDILKKASLTLDPRRLWIMDRQPGMHWSQAFDEARAELAVHELVVQGKADAIVSVNDLWAARIIAALRRCGRRVPDDVAVVGCDNLDVGTVVEPTITTVDLKVPELASATVGMLFELLDRGKVPEKRRAVIVAPELIARGST